MSILYQEQMQTDGKPSAIVTIDNGDLQALKSAMDQYQFVNQEALFRYALVALLNTTDNKLYVKKDDGNIVALNVSERLIKPSGE